MTEDELEAILQEALAKAYAEGRASGIASVTRYAEQYAENLKPSAASNGQIQAAVYTLTALADALKSGSVK